MGNPERWKKHRSLPLDIEERLQNLAPLLEKKGVLLAYIFGSLATKGEKAPRAPGDVDLAVLTREGPAWELQEALVERLGTDRQNPGGSAQSFSSAALRDPAWRQAHIHL